MMLSSIQYQNDVLLFFNINYLERNYNCMHFKLEHQLKFHDN